MSEVNPFFPALRSGHRLFQRPSPGSNFLAVCPDRLHYCFAVLGMAAFVWSGAGAAEAAPKPIDSAAPWELTLSGDDWKIASFEPEKGVEQRVFAEGFPSTAAETVAAVVPGDVHWDLERAGKIPPVFYGQNSSQIGWVAGREWWYRKTFAAPTSWPVSYTHLTLPTKRIV